MKHLSSIHYRHHCAFGFLSCVFSATFLLRHTQALASFPTKTECRRAMTVLSSLVSNNNENTVEESKIPLRILALHGSEGSGKQFAAVVTRLMGESQQQEDWQLHTVDAPFAKGNGLAWWLNPPGVRSYTAEEYPGIEDSIAAVTQALQQQQQQNQAQSSSVVDLIVAHSQGAILTTALLALQQQQQQQPAILAHPRVGYILNGGAWPNPYTTQLEALLFPEDQRPRILIVTGTADGINPPDSQQRVAAALRAAGAVVTTVEHAGGHGVPVSDPVAVREILDWIAAGMGESNTRDSYIAS